MDIDFKKIIKKYVPDYDNLYIPRGLPLKHIKNDLKTKFFQILYII